MHIGWWNGYCCARTEGGDTKTLRSIAVHRNINIPRSCVSSVRRCCLNIELFVPLLCSGKWSWPSAAAAAASSLQPPQKCREPFCFFTIAFDFIHNSISTIPVAVMLMGRSICRRNYQRFSIPGRANCSYKTPHGNALLELLGSSNPKCCVFSFTRGNAHTIVHNWHEALYLACIHQE